MSSDNDANFTKGGDYVTEAQETTSDPFFLVDKISGSLKGAELRAVPGSVEFDNIDRILQKSTERPVSCLVKMANGVSFSAKGGARIVVSGAGDGMVTTREGKLSVDIHPTKGEWAKA
ncbi:MAG: hypothetical protein ACTSRG_13085 [Candidatus Helarchaeota archaeon]